MDPAKLLPKLNRLLPSGVLEKQTFGRTDDPAIWVEVRAIRPYAEAICYDVDGGLDWLENISMAQIEGALVISYFARSSESLWQRLVMRASVVPSGAQAVVDLPSVRAIWPTAAPLEAEIAELFGVRFLASDGAEEARPGDHRLLPPELSSSHSFPLRKEFIFPTEVNGIRHARPFPGASGGSA